MQITLNLASRPYVDHRPLIRQLRLGMAVMGLLLALLALGMLHFHQAALRIEARREQLNSVLQQLQRQEEADRASMQLPANARVLTQADYLNHLFDEKSFSWTETMEDLETTLPAGVQVTAIEPVRDKQGRLTLRLRVTGQRGPVVDLLRAMEHSPRFVHPRIVGENAASGNGPGGIQPVNAPLLVNFDLLAEYSQATPAERKAALEARKHSQAKDMQAHSAQSTSHVGSASAAATKSRSARVRLHGSPVKPRPGSVVPR
jgi:type IV pilus assembly protein PilN